MAALGAEGRGWLLCPRACSVQARRRRLHAPGQNPVPDQGSVVSTAAASRRESAMRTWPRMSADGLVPGIPPCSGGRLSSLPPRRLILPRSPLLHRIPMPRPSAAPPLPAARTRDGSSGVSFIYVPRKPSARPPIAAPPWAFFPPRLTIGGFQGNPEPWRPQRWRCARLLTRRTFVRGRALTHLVGSPC